MPLNTARGPEDEAPLLDGDDRFFRVVMRGHPALLQPGMVAAAVNYRFRDGVPEPRGGTVKPAWLNQITGTEVAAWDSVQGRGTYVDPQARAWTLLAVNGAIFACLPHNAPRSVALPAGETLPDAVTFAQFRDTVYLMRGADQDPLRLSDLSVGFELVPDPVAAGVVRIPRGTRALTAGERLWVMTGTDQVWASDLLDATSYAAAHQYRFSDGIPDSLVTIAVFNDASLSHIIGLKKGSVWILNNIAGDLSTTKARPITARYGCDSADSVVDLGSDLGWWCSEGWAQLSLTIQGEIQIKAGGQWPPMLTDEIQPLVKRVRGDYASGITADLADGRLYIAVPLDAAESLQFELLSGEHFGAAPVPVTAGATYRYAPGANETSLLNGVTSITVASDFVAAGSTVTISGTGAITASLRRVYKGVNSAVLVYDYKALDPGWQGYDEAEGVLFPKYWFRRDYNGRERLFFLNADGWATLYEEGFEDARHQPYTDLTLEGELSGFAGSFSVNGGTTVAFDFGFAFNTNGTWGVAGLLATDRDNLFADEDIIGFQDGSWTHPNTHAVRITNGVRFYSLDGRRPVVTLTLDPEDEDALVASSNLWQPIVSTFLSRGYATPVKLERKTALKLQTLVETWDPCYCIALRSAGVNRETEFVTDKTRSRLIYDRPHTRAPWDPTNANDDFDTPSRQDYSLNLGTPFALGDGLGLGLHQEAEHTVQVRGVGRAHQVRITNTTGRLRILGIGYEGRRRERGAGVKI